MYIYIYIYYSYRWFNLISYTTLCIYIYIQYIIYMLYPIIQILMFCRCQGAHESKGTSMWKYIQIMSTSLYIRPKYFLRLSCLCLRIGTKGCGGCLHRQDLARVPCFPRHPCWVQQIV